MSRTVTAPCSPGTAPDCLRVTPVEGAEATRGQGRVRVRQLRHGAIEVVQPPKAGAIYTSP